MSEPVKKIEPQAEPEKKSTKYTIPPEVLEKTENVEHDSDEDLVDYDDWDHDKWEPRK